MTFIIDKEGQIARVFTSVDITKHMHEVVDALKRLTFTKPDGIRAKSGRKFKEMRVSAAGAKQS
jgi:alkyl hydroperoxide reductase subunit AhpC